MISTPKILVITVSQYYHIYNILGKMLSIYVNHDWVIKNIIVSLFVKNPPTYILSHY